MKSHQRWLVLALGLGIPAGIVTNYLPPIAAVLVAYLVGVVLGRTMPR